MGVFFGTDGLRGKVNSDLSFNIAYKVGNALGALNPNSKVLIGSDTRLSSDMLISAVCAGLNNAGSSATIIGVCPTAGIAYLTARCGFDFGIVISASHNPAEFNGIKIFDKTGKKLGDNRELELERHFLKDVSLEGSMLGQQQYKRGLVKIYKDFLTNSINNNLEGLKIVLDCANGAANRIAPLIFRRLGAKVYTIGSKPNGTNINLNCGALYPANLANEVIKRRANVGFAFDGDSDRVIAVNESGEIVDGDKIIYLFATYLKEKGELIKPVVVGTRHTNMGVEIALKKRGISLIRTDIGDKYVSERLEENGLIIGGEQSGHVFDKRKLKTGDGILNALMVASIIKEKNKNLSEFFNFKQYVQVNLNIKVNDKMRIINSETLSNAIENQEQFLGKTGRLMVRVSGTEPYIRIMAESKSKFKAERAANELKEIIENLNEEF